METTTKGMKKLSKEFCEIVVREYAGKRVSCKELKNFAYKTETETGLTHKGTRVLELKQVLNGKLTCCGRSTSAVYSFNNYDECNVELTKYFEKSKKGKAPIVMPSDKRIDEVYNFLKKVRDCGSNHIKFSESKSWIEEGINTGSIERINLLIENFFRAGKNLLRSENFYRTKGDDKNLYDSFSYNKEKLESVLFAIHEYRKKKEASSEPSFRYLISEMKEDELKEILGSERVQFKGIYGKDGNNNLYQVNLSDTSGLEKVKGTFYFMKKDTELMSVVEERRHLVANYAAQMEKMKKEFEENLQKLQKSL